MSYHTKATTHIWPLPLPPGLRLPAPSNKAAASTAQVQRQARLRMGLLLKSRCVRAVCQKSTRQVAHVHRCMAAASGCVPVIQVRRHHARGSKKVSPTDPKCRAAAQGAICLLVYTQAAAHVQQAACPHGGTRSAAAAAARAVSYDRQ